MSGPSAELATQVVRWQAAHGRNHLPWQNTRDAYRVWLSEIMLQQTQVATVLEYYTRFLARFPDVRQLAAAPQDEVLALWSGLGYYSRARNLHRCAQIVVHQHGGEFPRTVDELAALPGIGRSTAGAIAAFCFGVRAPILDANVRRVLTRVLGFGADLPEAKNERALWQQAEALLPRQDLSHAMPRYTQGLMDLGAGICLPRNPNCLLCPLQEACVARRDGNPQDYPVRTRKLKRSAQAWVLLMVRHPDGRFWLERRPKTGIWAGLHAFVMQPTEEAVLPAGAECEALPTFKHVLTHRDMHLSHWRVQFSAAAFAESWAIRQGEGGWHTPEQALALGLPKPVREQIMLWLRQA